MRLVVVSGRVETNFAIQLTLSGPTWTFGSASGKAVKCEGFLQGRMMEGGWTCGPVSGSFVLHLMSSTVGEVSLIVITLGGTPLFSLKVPA